MSQYYTSYTTLNVYHINSLLVFSINVGDQGYDVDESLFLPARDGQLHPLPSAPINGTHDGYEPILCNDRVCPVCEEPFDSDVDQEVFEEHVDSHYGKSCPICQQIFKDQDIYEEHVQNHFDETQIDMSM